MSTYKALIKRLELRPIKSEASYDAALEIAEELLLKLPNLNEDEEDYLKILSDLIGEYENIHHALSPSTTTPLENLKYLMNQNSLKQADLAKLLKVSSGRASEIWNGHRELSKTNVAILAEHFCVNASLFLPRIPPPESNSAVSPTTTIFYPQTSNHSSRVQTSTTQYKPKQKPRPQI
jgi:HTH-type transcriptional regulator/antitoxin HigA